VLRKQSTSSTLRCTASGSDIAIIEGDYVNAYNTCSRAKGLERLYAEESLRDGWRLFDFLYGKPSTLVARSTQGNLKYLQSREGWRQGCHFGGSAFAACTKRPVATTRQKHPDVTVFMYADNSYLIGPLAAVIAAKATLDAEISKECNVAASSTKSQLNHLHAAPT
jgi:hypothetical protein